MPVTREKLYEQVWAEPMTRVAERYNVSSSFLARICTRLNVPRPRRGYWAKREFGKAPEQPPLPDAGPGHELEWSPGGGGFTTTTRPLPKPPAERRAARPRASAEGLTEHPLLINVRALYEKVYPQSWSTAYPRPYKKRLPDIVASAEGVERALATANVLFLAMERRGYPVTLAPGDVYYCRPRLDTRDQPREPLPEYSSEGWRPTRETIVSVGTVAIGLTVFELSEYVEVESVNNCYVRKDTLPQRKRRESWRTDWVHKEDMPSGRLALRAYSPYPRVPWQQEWREKLSGELPAQADAIVRALTKAAPVIAERVAEEARKAEVEQRAREAQHRVWLKAEHVRKGAEAQKASHERLLAAIAQWARVREIETFLAEVDRQLAELPAAQRSAALDRLTRARDMIGATDALRWLLAWKTPEELYPEGFAE